MATTMTTVQAGINFENHENNFGMVSGDAFFLSGDLQVTLPCAAQDPLRFSCPFFFLHNFPVCMPDSYPFMYSIIEFIVYLVPE